VWVYVCVSECVCLCVSMWLSLCVCVCVYSIGTTEISVGISVRYRIQRCASERVPVWTGAEIRSSREPGRVCGFTVVYLSIRPHHTDVWGVGGGRGEGLARRSVDPSGSVADERER
jgi:hypothetical protein